MKLATLRIGGATLAARIEEDAYVDLGDPDLGVLLEREDWRKYAAAIQGERHSAAAAGFAPLVPHPQKIICVGLNYRQHIDELGLPTPKHPTLFAKFSPALIGARDDIWLPPASDQMDWEAELAIVIGARVRSASKHEAAAAIAGYTIMNDVTARDWQGRTTQWLQGKTFEHTTPLGPCLVTSNGAVPTYELRCEIDGEVMQASRTDDMVFDPITLVSYVSTILTLEPGDVIATGTPSGVGHARTPARYLRDGSVAVTAIPGIGECHNSCRAVGSKGDLPC